MQYLAGDYEPPNLGFWGPEPTTPFGKIQRVRLDGIEPRILLWKRCFTACARYSRDNMAILPDDISSTIP